MAKNNLFEDITRTDEASAGPAMREIDNGLQATYDLRHFVNTIIELSQAMDKDLYIKMRGSSVYEINTYLQRMRDAISKMSSPTSLQAGQNDLINTLNQMKGIKFNVLNDLYKDYANQLLQASKRMKEIADKNPFKNIDSLIRTLEKY